MDPDRHHFYRYMDDSVYRTASCSPMCTEIMDVRTPRYSAIQPYDDHRQLGYFDRPFEQSYQWRSRSPYNQGFYGFDSDMRWGSDDAIRSNNREAAIANGFTRWCRHTQLHPMMTREGFYPKAFNTPRLLPEIVHMNHHELDRVMMAYELGSSRRRYYQGPLVDRFDRSDLFYKSNAQRRRDLIALFEFLGAYQLVEHLRLRW